uniref:Mitochondrial core protein II n=1 Tax=Ceratosolen solmsi TaxID=142686 RepID=A0A0A1CMJ0_9HYME|nr:mitochondrial core protein II [Ceratosolen solmsi]
MACSVIGYPLLRNPSVRHYVATAAAEYTPMISECVKIIAGKTIIAAVNPTSPVALVSVIFKAGPRNENYESEGISHAIRICAGLTTSKSSAFGIARNVQQLGGYLTVSSEREFTSYTLKIYKNNLAPALHYLRDVSACQLFRHWEIADEIPRLRYESSTIPDNILAIELLHKAAYREGLGNSLYCPKRHIGKFGTDALNEFVSNYFTGSRCAIVSSGLSFEKLEEFACSVDASTEMCGDIPSKYHERECRKDRLSNLAHVAVAVEGSSFENRKDCIAFAILQKIAGHGPQVKRGGSQTSFYKAVSQASEDIFAVGAFNAVYSDSGLFGFILNAPSKTAGSLVKAGVQWLRSLKITDEDVVRGKQNFKLDVFDTANSIQAYHNNIIHQLLFTDKIVSVEDILCEIDSISTDDIKRVR